MKQPGLVACLSHGFADDPEEVSDVARLVADDLARPEAGQTSERDFFNLHAPLVDRAFVAQLADALHLRFECCRAACDPLVAAQLVLAVRVCESLDLQAEQVGVDRDDVLSQLVLFEQLLRDELLLLSSHPSR